MSAAGRYLFYLVICLTAATAPGRASDWTSADYVALYFQHHNGQVPLPHLREARPRATFNHLVDPQNITRIVQSDQSNEDKARELRLIMSTLGGFRAAYNLAVIVGEPLQQELTLVQAYSLTVADALAGIEQTSQDNADTASAWATLISDVVTSVGDSSKYTPAQSAMLADAVARHYPAIAPVLDPEHRRRLMVQAETLHFSAENRSQLQAVARMQRALMQGAER